MRLADEAAEDMCANKSVGDTENNVAADVKACADEAVDVGGKTCVDDAADNIGDPSVDENAVLENVVGNANELGDVAIVGADDKDEPKTATFCPKTRVAIWACSELNDKSRETSDDDNFPVELPALPLLHGSLADHGSMTLEFIEVP